MAALGQWASAREYGSAVARHWVSTFLGVIAAALGFVAEATGFSVPSWAWWTLAVVFLSYAQFRAFHEMRVARDTAQADALSVRAEIDQRFSDLRGRLNTGDTRVVFFTTPAGQQGADIHVSLRNDATDIIDYEMQAVEVRMGAGIRRELPAPLRHPIMPGDTDLYICPSVFGFTLPVYEGTVELTATYGHPTGGPRFWMRRSLHFHFEYREPYSVPVAHGHTTVERSDFPVSESPGGSGSSTS